MGIQLLRGLLVGCAAIAVSGCGGGGGGVESTPFVPTPPPPPPPPPQGGSSVLPPEHIGLVSDKPFAVLGVGYEFSNDTSTETRSPLTEPAAKDVEFSFDAATNTYQISLPDFQAGKLTDISYGGTEGQVATSSWSRVSAGSSSSLQDVHVFLPVPGTQYSPYSYTSFGFWDGFTSNGIGSHGLFAYGIPTAAGDVPITGSANYSADIIASYGVFDYGSSVTGDVSLSFDFGAGTLSGYMHPQIIDAFDGFFVDYGRYDFTQTVYSSGSTTFSGKFIVPNMPDADSFFDGRFTGPKAAELMARFVAPYKLSNGEQGTLSGIWIGKKVGP